MPASLPQPLRLLPFEQKIRGLEYGLVPAAAEVRVDELGGARREDGTATAVNGASEEAAVDSRVAYVCRNEGSDILVAQADIVGDGGRVDFGVNAAGTSSTPVTFTISNPGIGDLSRLAVTLGLGKSTNLAVPNSCAPFPFTGQGAVMDTAVKAKVEGLFGLWHRLRREAVVMLSLR